MVIRGMFVFIIIAGILIQIRYIVKGEYVRNNHTLDIMDRIVRKDERPVLFWGFIIKNLLITAVSASVFYKFLVR